MVADLDPGLVVGDQTGTLKLEPYGPDAWLLRFSDRLGDSTFRSARAICTELDNHPPPGLMEYVPAYTSILLEFSPHAPGNTTAVLESLLLRLLEKLNEPITDGLLHDIRVAYDGPDLERVMEHSGLCRKEVIERHCAPVYRVDLIGFAPGFPYLSGLDPALAIPRLDLPRVQVDAGCVAIGGEQTGIYPISGPGGWNLIGRTDVKLFAPDTARCLLAPGDRVRFVSGKL